MRQEYTLGLGVFLFHLQQKWEDSINFFCECVWTCECFPPSLVLKTKKKKHFQAFFFWNLFVKHSNTVLGKQHESQIDGECWPDFVHLTLTPEIVPVFFLKFIYSFNSHLFFFFWISIFRVKNKWTKTHTHTQTKQKKKQTFLPSKNESNLQKTKDCVSIETVDQEDGERHFQAKFLFFFFLKSFAFETTEWVRIFYIQFFCRYSK